jgi:inorganic pyrophosphatase
MDPKFPKVVEVVVEIPAGSRNKYEYGYIDGTRADDGDHTDAMILLAEPTFPGCHITARPVGGLRMRDDKGDDFKVLCVALGDPVHQHIKRLDQVPAQRLREIEHFFATYKLLEDKHVDVNGWADLDAALELLRNDHRRWLKETEAAAESSSNDGAQA